MRASETGLLHLKKIGLREQAVRSGAQEMIRHTQCLLLSGPADDKAGEVEGLCEALLRCVLILERQTRTRTLQGCLRSRHGRGSLSLESRVFSRLHDLRSCCSTDIKSQTRCCAGAMLPRVATKTRCMGYLEHVEQLLMCR